MRDYQIWDHAGSVKSGRFSTAQIYTSNSELSQGRGGAGAIRFDQEGRIVDAYPILTGTSTNCAGGPTPWGTWLSCEEHSDGMVYECDIYGQTQAVLCRGLGKFKHEAAAVDPVHQHIYLTEDEKDGRLYRYTPRDITSSGRMNLQQGRLEVAAVDKSGHVSWLEVPYPIPSSSAKPTRQQVKQSRGFNGGEGIWYHEGTIYFTSKGDDCVWSYSTTDQRLGLVYDPEQSKHPILSGVDNIIVSRDGHILVAEDGGDMQIVVLGPYGDVYPLLHMVNQDHSEIAGPAITPNHDRLYFSSQRGIKNGSEANGATYEIRGNFG
ncbi:MAG TPA: alkaline phosphatase PhoX [Oligoflexus sp.]|uniref:alkaline phosphatase PhoX n=1 Tax=Oligoflexus sp. TaxID=1971216 RepID=UPI002D2AE7B9|nr:alkaline phosphatase PhoX [Oligoflexus sp.]HYX32132.1 alkaline phosphatase PhoX [Oligoflexus sp.]